jgi:uncharacterized protein (TIGR03067 family)
MSIMGNSLRLDGPDKVEWYDSIIALAPNESPKQLKVSISECPVAEFVGKSSRLIYKIEGDTLTMVGNKPGVPHAPKDFNGDGNSRRFVFKRAQQAATGSAAKPPAESTKVIPGLGTVTDPNSDCQITGDATRLTISIPGSDHALVTEQKRMTAPRILQEVSGDFTAQVKILANYPKDTATIVPGRLPFQGAGCSSGQIPIPIFGSRMRSSNSSVRVKLITKSIKAGNYALPASRFAWAGPWTR